MRDDAPIQIVMNFSGVTINEGGELDGRRLNGQLARVWSLMRDGTWRTLGEIAATVAGSEAGVSARLRDIRKPGFPLGARNVQRRRVTGGLWEYRVAEERP